ncbi:glutamate--cysteine ligase regulatory subunit-like [Stegodyphus dumicola]|uniref:glutamate--cysteine ligase regulatory subunit-like n=1 Tax=Stegodyphus dumicola TaxID=202533 RepID=UPI0015AC5A13|nr:glutamate--cysteine ligase regulatory subunit-like [Stegodyphus dumicola]
MKDLDVSVIDSLILSLPPPPNAETLTLAHIKPLWKVLEQLVHDGKVVTIGISDLDTHQLAELYDWTEVKPSVNQVNLESCCVMPPEMTAFARANDIQLLTHNDPKDLLPKTLQPKILESGIANPDGWKVNWIRNTKHPMLLEFPANIIT